MAGMTQAAFEKGLKERMEEQLGYEGLTLGDVRSLLSGIGDEISASLKGEDSVRVRSIGTFKKKKYPATKARKGISPFTKEETTFAAKPARTKVTVSPAKEIKAAFAGKK